MMLDESGTADRKRMEHRTTTPVLSTSGGTSDARFIKDVCPVAELGLQNATAHMVDENVRVDDVRDLAKLYAAILKRYFAPAAG